MGWTSDVVRLARVMPLLTEQTTASPAKASAVLRLESTSVLAVASVSPIVGGVPFNLSLAPLAPIEKGKPRVAVAEGVREPAPAKPVTSLVESDHSPSRATIAAARPESIRN